MAEKAKVRIHTDARQFQFVCQAPEDCGCCEASMVPLDPQVIKAGNLLEERGGDEKSWFHLTTLTTDPEVRRRGYASKLMRKVAQLCDVLGLYVETYPYPDEADAPSRKQLIKFFSEFGFEIGSSHLGEVIMFRRPKEE